MSNPNTLRKEILAARNLVEPATRTEKSLDIHKRLLALPEISESNSIFLYVSFRSEVETETLLRTLISQGKEVAVPITHVEEKRLDAIRINDPKSQLVPGYCDIPEPREEILVSNLVPPENLEAVILPGSVFDERGGRFGYGGGFYDRFVSRVPKAHRIGLAFDLQIVPRAPLQDHDELLDLIVTESRYLRAKPTRVY